MPRITILCLQKFCLAPAQTLVLTPLAVDRIALNYCFTILCLQKFCLAPAQTLVLTPLAVDRILQLTASTAAVDRIYSSCS